MGFKIHCKTKAEALFIGFDTIEINLAVSAGVVDNIFDIIVCVIVVVIVAVVFLDKKNPAINLIKNRRGNS